MDMKKFQLLGVALIAVFAFGVIAAASASAVEFLLAEWLVNGNPITTELATESEGELLLEETILGIKIDKLCSGIFVGTIGPTGEDKITELLNLALEPINLTALVELGLECVNDQNCPEPLVWAVHLPWNTLLELMVEGTETFFVDLISNSGAGNPGWYEICMGNSTSDECTTVEGASKVTNEAGGLVDGEFSEAFTELAGLKLANCSTAGAEHGIVEGLGTTLTSEGALTASSEP